MALEAIIKRFEAEAPGDADFEHPLARDIVEELAQCKENELQATLFGDARKLADHIIEEYLCLGREDKLKMAETYKKEFSELLGGISSGKRKHLQVVLGKTNLNFLLQISNYSKLVSILENYIEYVKTSKTNLLRSYQLSYYLYNHNTKGKKVERGSKNSMKKLYEYDIKNNKIFNKKNNSLLFDSMTWGISEKVMEEMIDARSILKPRIKILESYLANLERNTNLKISNSSLQLYLATHDIDGNKLEKNKRNSLQSFIHYDFKNNQDGKTNGFSLLESITFRVPDNLRKKVFDTATLLTKRI